MLERFLFVWLISLCGAAYGWPTIQASFPWLGDPFLATTPTMMSALIAITMFAVGMMLPRNEVEEVRQRWPAVLYGTAIQYSAMPLLGFGVAKLFQLGPEYFAGIIIVGCVPGAMASNIVTLNARGHTSFSVSLTTTSTLLSPIVVPTLLAWCLAADKQLTIPWLDTSRNLFLTVVLPVAGGFIVGRRFPRIESIVNRIGSTVANFTILWIIATVVGKNRDKLVDVRSDLLWALATVNFLGYAAGYLAGWVAGLPESMRRALTIEIGMQNAGLGVLLASRLFAADSAATIPPALYTFGCMLSGTIAARTWAMTDDWRARRKSHTAP